MPTPEQMAERPYFNAEQLTQPLNEYVAWFDVVGTRSHLTQSHLRAANFFAKIHLAAIRAAGDTVRLYPVMDGVYVTSASRRSMLDFVRAFYRLLVITFCAESESKHRFTVRGALAFGPVTHGNTIPESCAGFPDDSYKDYLLIGIAMIQAYESETHSPPFGLFVHESARAFAPEGQHPLSGRWLHWWRNEDEPLVSELRVALPAYFNWAAEHSREVDYPVERIVEHRKAAFEYFGVAEP